MIYKFTYYYKNNTLTKICTTEKEADAFFNILLAFKCDYIRVITFKRNRH